jgi:hypothetical protein
MSQGEQQTSGTAAMLGSIMARLDSLQAEGRVQASAIAKHPGQIADMEEQCKMVLARSKRDRDMDPGKQGTAKQLDVIESAQAHLKKAKKALLAIRLQVPRTDANNVMVEPIVLDTRALAECSEIDDAMAAFDKGLAVLEHRESVLLVIFNSDSHKQAYVAIEQSDLAEGGGSLGHLEDKRKKLIMDIVSKGNDRNDKV